MFSEQCLLIMADLGGVVNNGQQWLTMANNGQQWTTMHCNGQH